MKAIEKVLVNSLTKPALPELASLSTGSTEQGLVIIPKFQYLVPIHGGRLQVQHGTELPISGLMNNLARSTEDNTREDTVEVVFCGFSGRAENAVIYGDGQRPVNDARLRALDDAIELIGLGVSGKDLLTEEYDGSTPAKIYRSFVCPRPRTEARHNSLVTVEKEAKQKAQQIAMALRQLRADRSTYLRNIDKPLYSSHQDESGTETDLPGTSKPPTVHPIVFVLDNLRSANNVGCIFRSAETAGAAEVVTCGITAHPPNPKLMKTAMQSVNVVPSRHFEDTLVAIQTLKDEGYTIVAMETTSLSKTYTDVQFTGKIALVLGHELTGVDTRVMEVSDMIIEIPTYGVKNSLNVASAASIVLFEILRQWTLKV